MLRQEERAQAPHHVQEAICDVLGLPEHKVTVHTKRLGGGFGGKESRPAFIAAATVVPAYLLKRPVRIVLDRDEDMHITGHRHPFYATYKARPLLLHLLTACMLVVGKVWVKSVAPCKVSDVILLAAYYWDIMENLHKTESPSDAK